MNVGIQLEAPDGLGSMTCGTRYYYSGRHEQLGALLISFIKGKSGRWRPDYLHISADLFEKELTASPPGIRPCKQQFQLPEPIKELEGINFEGLASSPGSEKKTHKQLAESRLSALAPLLDKEDEILRSDSPIRFISKIGRDFGSRVHPHDLQYWFFAYILHGRNLWSLKAASQRNGTWNRAEEAHANKKFGRPSLSGKRAGCPSAQIEERILNSYLKHCESGKSLTTIHREACVSEFGCQVTSDGLDGRKFVHRQNLPFPTYGQYHYVVNKHFGAKQVQLTKYGSSRMSRASDVDQGNTTGRLANILEHVEIDVYHCDVRASSCQGEVMPPLCVARAICATTGAVLGIGFSLGGETKVAYRAMLWSMAVDKSLVADVYGISAGQLDWPIKGLSRALLSDRGPGGHRSLIDKGDAVLAKKTLTPSFTPKSKPNIESGNPRSYDQEGAPSYLQSELQIGALMKQEVFRAAAHNRSTSIADRLSPAMVVDFHRLGLTATPQSLWRYLDERLRTSAAYIDSDNAARKFLQQWECSLDRVGVLFNTIHYNSNELRDNGLHEKLVRSKVKTLTAYSVSLAHRVLWVEIQGRLYKLEALRRIRYDEEELNVPISELENINKQKRQLESRTRESIVAAQVELADTVHQQTGQYLGSGRRRGGSPGRSSKGSTRNEVDVIKSVAQKKVA